MPEYVVNAITPEQDLAELDSAIAQVSAIKSVVSIQLEKTEQRLLAIHENLNVLDAQKRKMLSFVQPLKNIAKGKEDIAYYAAFLQEVLIYVEGLDRQKKYQDALIALDALNSKFLPLDYGIALKSQKLIREILEHEKACIYSHMGESNIRNEFPPLSDEEMDAYRQIAQNLGTQIDGEAGRYYHMDKLVGFGYANASCRFRGNIRGKDDFLAALAVDGDLSKPGLELSDITQVRRNEFLVILYGAYNDLAKMAFEGDDYEEALFYFEHRDYIPEDCIAMDAFKLPNETEFHYAYGIDKAEKKSIDEFYDYAKAQDDALFLHDEYVVGLVARLLADENLPESYFELLAAELKKTDFETMVIVFGEAIKHNLPEERQFSLVNLLVHTKKKRGDFEKMGEALYTLSQELAPSQQKAFKGLKKDLLRSPHAHRVALKSGEEELHYLYGETPETIRLPLGKREKKPLIKSWDFMVMALYIGLAIILPLAVGGAAPFLIQLANISPMVNRLSWIAMPVVCIFVALLAIHRRFGFDERGSDVWGKVFGITGILVAGLSFAFFFMPKQLTFVAPYCYGVLGLGAMCLLATLLLKQKKNVYRTLMTIPTVLLLIASIVFLVIDLMNGIL